jgi:peptidoglycan/LPS O-acetylase OafA/YrhL
MPAVDATPVDRAGGRAPRLPSLAGLRFVAAAMVFMVHASFPQNPLNRPGPISFFADHHIALAILIAVYPAGYLGVSFFFQLSGFIMTWTTPPGDSARVFWRRRALKIFPNHVIVWIIAMILFAGPITPWWAATANLFLLHTWIPVPRQEVMAGVNAPAWSLCAEVLFYALFPLLIGPIRRIPVRRLWTWAGVMVAGMAVFAMISKFIISGQPRSPFLPISMMQMWFAYSFPPARMFEFVLGMIMARIVMEGRWPHIRGTRVVILVVVAYLVALVVPPPFNFCLVTALPFGLMICSATAADLRGVRTILNSRAMVWLGTVSFAIYICQGVVIFWGRPAVTGAATYSWPVAILLTLALFLATLASGAILHTFVEEPIMRRWSRSRTSSGAVPPAVEPAPEAVPAPPTATVQPATVVGQSAAAPGTATS